MALGGCLSISHRDDKTSWHGRFKPTCPIKPSPKPSPTQGYGSPAPAAAHACCGIQTLHPLHVVSFDAAPHTTGRIHWVKSVGKPQDMRCRGAPPKMSWSDVMTTWLCMAMYGYVMCHVDSYATKPRDNWDACIVKLDHSIFWNTYISKTRHRPGENSIGQDPRSHGTLASIGTSGSWSSCRRILSRWNSKEGGMSNIFRTFFCSFQTWRKMPNWYHKFSFVWYFSRSNMSFLSW